MLISKFQMVLHVNNSLVRCVRPASSWPHDSITIMSLDMSTFQLFHACSALQLIRVIMHALHFHAVIFFVSVNEKCTASIQST